MPISEDKTQKKV